MRDVLLLTCCALAAPLLLGTAVAGRSTPMPARDAVDHLLLGASDLDQGIAWVERLTGVRAVVGGTHPGRGTRNALLSLGGRQYLEILAPDPAQSSTPQSAQLTALKEPGLIAWAAVSTDLDALAVNSRAAGQNMMGPRDGSRARPDGKVLRWRSLTMVTPLSAGAVDPIPFLIEWSKDSVHPSQDSPKGCELQALEIEHPDPGAVTKALGHLGIEATVKQGASTRLVATLRTPKGIVTLGS